MGKFLAPLSERSKIQAYRASSYGARIGPLAQEQKKINAFLSAALSLSDFLISFSFS